MGKPLPVSQNKKNQKLVTLHMSQFGGDLLNNGEGLKQAKQQGNWHVE